MSLKINMYREKKLLHAGFIKENKIQDTLFATFKELLDYWERAGAG